MINESKNTTYLTRLTTQVEPSNTLLGVSIYLVWIVNLKYITIVQYGFLFFSFFPLLKIRVKGLPRIFIGHINHPH